MSKTVSNKKQFTFVGGLNTEAGPLTFPPNVWADGLNIEPDIDGSISKRAAVDYELDFSTSATLTTDTLTTTGAFATGEWNAAGGNGEYNYVVVQRADKLHFYINSGDGVSAREQVGWVVDLSTYKVAGNPNTSGVALCSFSNANGKLLVTSSDTYPLLITFNISTQSISVETITIYIRDVFGVNDGMAVNYEPAVITNPHRYNLQNQGWTEALINAYAASQLKYPSNAQVWTAGKDASDNFDPTLLVKQDFGTTPAARGRYILPAFIRNRDSVSGIPAGLVETEQYYPTVSTFYAGRAWYAGMKSALMNTWLMFSQVADSSAKFGYCYQEADPTSEFISDLVDTDGGVIPIQDAGTIVALRSAYNSLLVFADNGVWQIQGGLDSGFSATSFEVKKLTSTGCLGPQTIVEVGTHLFYWATDGIWRISPTQTGALQVDNITATSIHTLYTSIPMAGRVFASGQFHAEDNRVYWLYNDSDTQDSINYRFLKNRMLILDMRLGAFFTHEIERIEGRSPYITDLVVTKNRTSTAVEFSVTDTDENSVVDSSGNTVTVIRYPDVLKNTSVRFLTLVFVPPVWPFFFVRRWTVTFSSFDEGITSNPRFHDWFSYDQEGATYDAYLLTGYDAGNNQGIDKSIQGLYVTCFLRRTETGVDTLGEPINPSSCTLQSRWDWTDNTVAGKWSDGEEVYRHKRPYFAAVPSATYEDGYPVVVTKSKIRGRGKVVQIKFTADPEKDMQLLGWAVTYIGNSNV